MKKKVNRVQTWKMRRKSKTKKERNRKEKYKKRAFRPQLVLCLSPHSHLSASWLHVFYKLCWDAERGQYWEIWHSFTFLLVCTSPALFFLLQEERARWNSKGPKKKQHKSFKQQNPRVSPKGSVWLPCGCNVFVRPSPLITIMSLELHEGKICVL